GKWMGCSAPCGGGIDTYKVLSPKVGTGLDCPYTDGDTQVCNTAACAASVDCGGYWNACDPSTGTKTFTITQAPSGGGASCPAPLTQTCPVDCVGNWGACVSGSKTFTWSIPALNGGIACTFANGQTDTTGCATTPGPPPASRICNGSDLACSVWLGCDFGMESWFQQLSPTTGILHYHVNSSCQTPYYRATPYIWDGSAWVPSGAPTSSGGIPRSPCIHPC
ncbi:MAG TPA: hypothetical protein VN132_02550, partial [Bdellovibrio sp.]|nr:hypothetical protein [Bdellovibrio sp.]